MGNLTDLVIHRAKETRTLRDKSRAASSFAHGIDLPFNLKEQLLAHLCLKFTIKSDELHHQEILDSLPRGIQSNVSRFRFNPVVNKTCLFQGISEHSLLQLVSAMKLEDFPPKVDVILQNDASTDFYILMTGAVDLIEYKDGKERVVCEEGTTGDIFGEIGVLCYKPQLLTVRTKLSSQLLRMSRTSFLNIIKSNVYDGAIIMNNLLQHLADLKDPAMQRVLSETENMLAWGQAALPMGLFFAAIRGDDMLLHQLLKRGFDPNESDSSGRTALHIAASKGSENCSLLLLNNRPDPNSRDSGGSVPVWEAILGRHEPVIKILLDKGATIVSGDVGQFACTAAEQNSLDLLEDIVRCRGDVTLLRSDSTTALHIAVSLRNCEVVKFLFDQGADMDKHDAQGWTPRALADQQGHEGIKALFEAKNEHNIHSLITMPGPTL